VNKIIYNKGNALHGSEPYLAHGCNNKGVMGSGIARQIREVYPGAYDIYRNEYNRNGLSLGDVIFYIKHNEKTILNWITQDGYGRDGKQYVSYEAIKDCILKTNKLVPLRARIAMPKIGAGLGGGDWNIIANLLQEHAKFQPVVYEL
jgi:O-acetyl-ADP-ribose deacetylase (regulator of RNase III)